jgi:hypothetical protein
VSGAPKIRAMQIISELEGTTHGPYAGCVGCFSFNGSLDMCITIRTTLSFPHNPHPACGQLLPLPRARDSVQAGTANTLCHGTPRTRKNPWLVAGASGSVTRVLAFVATMSPDKSFHAASVSLCSTR